MKKRKVEIAEGKFLDKKKKIRIKFADFSRSYFEYSKNNKKSCLRDRTNIKHLNTHLGDYYLSEITPWLIEKYKAERKSHLSLASVNRELACLKHIYTKAIEWGKATNNPAKPVRLFKEKNRRLRYLTRQEIIRLLEACSHLKPIVITALCTGMRKAEILNLKWQDINFAQKIICVYETKNSERKEVPISNYLTQIIKYIRKNEGEYVFGNKNGKPFGNVRKSFDAALRRAGIEDFRFHDLRHTFASHLVMSGVDLTTVKELLGHKDIKMTLRYSHLSPDHKLRAMEIIGTMMDTKRSYDSDALHISI